MEMRHKKPSATEQQTLRSAGYQDETGLQEVWRRGTDRTAIIKTNCSLVPWRTGVGFEHPEGINFYSLDEAIKFNGGVK